MPVSHYAFRLLPLHEQLATVFTEGTFLMTRWEEESAINLYWLTGQFFAEVYYDEVGNLLYQVQAFTSMACLADYLCYVRLPGM